MSDLEFTVIDAVPEQYAATPTLVFRLRVTESSGEPIHAIALRCQIRIEPQRRPYSDREKDRLADLFGTPDRWTETVKPFLWTHVSTMVRGFTGSMEFDLPVSATYDFEVAGAKYLNGVTDGHVPLVLLFSGTVFTRGTNGFGVEHVPWHLEANYRLPVRALRDAMDHVFANTGWIRVHRDSLDALLQFKTARGLTTWEQAFDALLAPVSEAAS